jgi:hypothetical protein
MHNAFAVRRHWRWRHPAVHHVEVPGRKELQLQILDQGQVRHLVLPRLGQRALRGQQDIGEMSIP